MLQSKANETENLSCTLCGEIPQGNFDLTGLKIIDGEERRYQVCKKCCFDVGRINPYDQKSSSKRKLFWDNVMDKI